MSEAVEPRELQWRDLSAEEVYYIAGIENDIRDDAADALGRLAFSSTPIEPALFRNAKLLLENNESRANSWLRDQTALKDGLEIISYSGKIKEESAFSSWLHGKITLQVEMTAKELAAEVGISEGYLSGLRRGKRGLPSPEVFVKLVSALSERITPDDIERDAFMQEARLVAASLSAEHAQHLESSTQEPSGQ